MLDDSLVPPRAKIRNDRTSGRRSACEGTGSVLVIFSAAAAADQGTSAGLSREEV